MKDYQETDIHTVLVDYILIIKAKMYLYNREIWLTLLQSDDQTYYQSSRKLASHGQMTLLISWQKYLTFIKCVGKTQTNPYWRASCNKGLDPSKMFFIRKDKKGGGNHWILKETKEDLTTKGNTWSLAGYWFWGRNIRKDDGRDLNMNQILYNSIVSMLKLLTSKNIGVN